MKGFKDSTKTHYSRGGSVGCAGAAKEAAVLSDFKGGRAIRRSDGGAVARANRSQRVEAAEEERLLRETTPRPTRGNRPNYTREETPTPPRPRSTRGPTGAGFNARPLVGAPRGTRG